MKAKRLNLSEFKVQVASNKNENDVSKLMGAVLGDCHDDPTVAPRTRLRPGRPERIMEEEYIPEQL